MDTKHDAIIAVSDDGTTFLVKITTASDKTVDTINGEISLCGEIGLENNNTPAGLYHASLKFNYCRGEYCGAYLISCDCGSLQWGNLQPIYQLPGVE